MPLLKLHESPHAPGVSPVKIYYRDSGRGKPLLYLHGGWGYSYYPVDRQMEEFGGRFRFLIPDRTGCGRSTHWTGDAPLDFHRQAAAEMTALLDALGIEKCSLWGHSDGAVIAVFMGLANPDRYERLLLEAFHYYRGKVSSREFFARAAVNPGELKERTRERLAAEHGETYWTEVVRRNAQAWLRIGEPGVHAHEDLYDGRLGELTVPTLFLHGRLDPRTEPGEMARVREVFPKCEMRFIENGRHSPHSQDDAFQEFNAVMSAFLRGELDRD